jgi:2'-5' RNA ligase
MPLVLPRFNAWTSQEGYGELLALPCFFALLPSEDVAPEVLRIAETWAGRFRLDWRRHGQPNPHVSFSAFTRMARVIEPPVAIQKAMDALDFMAFDVRFDKIRSYETRKDRRPLVLEADAETTDRVRSFAKAISTTMLYRAGLKMSPFSNIQPHITLLYDPRHCDVVEPIEPIQWRAKEFVLIRSHVGGKTHEELGRWNLR